MREGAVPVSLGRRGILHLSTRKASDFAKLCLGLLCDEREHLRLADFALELSVLTMDWDPLVHLSTTI